MIAAGRRPAAPATPAREGEQTEARQSLWQYGLVLMLVALVAESFVEGCGDEQQLRTLIAARRRRAMVRGRRGARRSALAALRGADRLLPALRSSSTAAGAVRALALVLLGAAAGLLARSPPRRGHRRGSSARPDDRRVARFIEERAGGCRRRAARRHAWSARSTRSAARSRTRGAVRGAGRRGGAARLEGDRSGAARAGRGDPPRRARSRRAARRCWRRCSSLGWPALSHAVETARLRCFPASVTVEVMPGDARVVAGQPLKIRARAAVGRAGAEPPAAAARRRGRRRAADRGDEPRRGDALRRSRSSRSTAPSVPGHRRRDGIGDYTVTALFPPRVERIEIHYRYPAFSGLAPREEQDGGDIYAPAGTRVRVRIHTDKPIASGRAGARHAVRCACGRRGDRTSKPSSCSPRDDSYRIKPASTATACARRATANTSSA